MTSSLDFRRPFGIELELSRQLTRVNNKDKKNSRWWQVINEEISRLQSIGEVTPGWRLKTDLSCGGEIVSPVLSYPQGIRDVAIICDKIKRIEKQARKPAFDGECGVHLHFDATDYPSRPRRFSNLLNIVQLAEVIFYQMYPNRRMDYCSPMTLNMTQGCRIRDMSELRDIWYRGTNNIKDPDTVYTNSFIASSRTGERYDGTRYHGLNLHCFWQLGTVEFRYCEATFDPLHILAWYELCLSIVNTAAHSQKINLGTSFRSMTFRELTNYWTRPQLFRKLIILIARTCNLSRNAVRLVLHKIKKNNPSLLTKSNSKPKLIIDRNKAGNYYYRVGGVLFDCYGMKVIIGDGRPVIVSTIKGENGSVGRIISAQSNILIDHPIYVDTDINPITPTNPTNQDQSVFSVPLDALQQLTGPSDSPF